MTTSEPRKLVIYGTGGFSREVLWLLQQSARHSDYELVGFVDDAADKPARIGTIPVFSFSEAFKDPGMYFTVAIGNGATRKSIVDRCNNAGGIAITLSDPSVIASNSVRLEAGSIICAGCIMTVDIDIGSFVHVNLGCTVGHDVTIKAFSTLSPGVNVSGNVVIEEGAFIGSGATIINGTSDQKLVIGCESVIAAGACVTKPVPPRTLYAGVPASLKKSF